MNLMQLKYFISICELGTVSAAAEYLHIAQPSLSLAIKELEKEFGAPLFQRKHKGMYLTTEGELFLTMARDIVERADSAEKIMKDVGGSSKRLRLGVPPMIGSFVLPILYGDFAPHNPDISLDIVECGKEEILKMIAENQLDMAFISHGKSSEPAVEFLHMDKMEIVCAASHTSKVTAKKALSPKDLAGLPLVMYKDGFFQSSEIKKWFLAGDTKPNILLKTSQLSTMIKLISSGTAVGFLFEKLTRNEPEIAAIPLYPPITVDISLIWKKDKFQLAGMKSLKSFLKERAVFQ